MEFLVYLAGPIRGCTYEEGISWREYVVRHLPGNIKALSPMRGKNYLVHESIIKGTYEDEPLSCQKGITCRDRFDVMRCDLLFVNLLGAKQISVGSVIEVAWADMLRKPIVIVMEEENIHDHPMIREVAGFIVSNLDDAIHYTVMILSPATG